LVLVDVVVGQGDIARRAITATTTAAATTATATTAAAATTATSRAR
jgi:hypothetical protein